MIPSFRPKKIGYFFKDPNGNILAGFSFYKNPPLVDFDKLMKRWGKELTLTQEDFKDLDKSLERLRKRAEEIYNELEEERRIKENKKFEKIIKKEKESFEKRLPSIKKKILELNRNAGLK